MPLYLTGGWAVLTIVLIFWFAPTVARILDVGIGVGGLIAAGIPLLLALSVLAHELAHGLVAQRLGVPVREYVLSLWGGHTAFGEEIDRPGASALVAGVGPATNGVLAIVFVAVGRASDERALSLVLLAVAFTNAFVAVFNILPALPMDGGRLLESLIWRVSGDRDLGTLVAARVGQASAVLIALAGAAVTVVEDRSWTTMIWALLIAAVLWQGASAAARTAQARRATRDVDLLAWAVPVVLLDADAPVAALQGVDAAGIVLVAGGDGRPVGWVQPAAVQAVPPQALASTPLIAVAARLPAEALLRQHRGSEAVGQLARAARAGARIVVLVGLDDRPIAALDVLEASKRLPH